MQFLLENLELLIFLILLSVGFFAGRWVEARHYRSIRKREKTLRKVLTFATRFPPQLAEAHECCLVTGSVVVTSDYFKQFVAGLRNLVGGRFRGYETLMDRARREAILRMKEDAQRQGFRLILNVKLESTSISGARQGTIPSFEILAYGTALRPMQSANNNAV